ncbi:hypothetical protein HDV04_003795 [Boothiomyces sp. JEL0838]|nr:hypothetical protein HDV04_003795 [Boothiomyces sp. JEL0838]
MVRESQAEKAVRFLEETTPEERKNFLKEGIVVETVGERVSRAPKSVAAKQGEKIEKLFQRIDIPVDLPANYKEEAQPDYVHNIPVQSSGSGHGDNSIYRVLFKKDHSKGKLMDIEAEIRQEQEDFTQKIELNKKLAAERTAKKREKRLKKKTKLSKKDLKSSLVDS